MAAALATYRETIVALERAYKILYEDYSRRVADTKLPFSAELKEVPEALKIQSAYLTSALSQLEGKPQPIAGDEVLRRYENIDPIMNYLLENDHLLKVGDKNYDETISQYLAGKGLTLDQVVALGPDIKAYFTAYDEIKTGEDNFTAGINDVELSKREREYGKWTTFLFDPAVIASGVVGYGDNKTTDFAQFLSGMGETAAAMGPIPKLHDDNYYKRLIQLMGIYEYLDSPEMLDAFVAGYAISQTVHKIKHP